mmetsp:Transcript_20337/g.44447  ORF Transcript_20337/g.44447 Transcript_20337/m.44447 type:complete len:375 (+) Transcript_20337:748-1872(+)
MGYAGHRLLDEGQDVVGLGPHGEPLEHSRNVGSCQGGHARAGPHGCRSNVRHDDGVGLLCQAGLHGGLVLKHVQPAPELGVRFEMGHQCCLIDDRPACRVDEHRCRLHERQPLLVDEVVRRLVQVAVQAHHIRLPQHLLNALHALDHHRGLTIVPEQLAVLLDVLLQLLVGVGIVVHEVHLVALHHHAGIGCTNTPSTDDAHCLVLQQLPHKQGGKPALVLARPHEHIGLGYAACCSQCQCCGQLRRGLSQHAWCVADGDLALGGLFHLDIVVAHCVVAVRLAASTPQRLKQLGTPVLCELADDTIALLANQLLDSCVRQNGVMMLAHFHPAACLLQDLKPSVTRQLLGYYNSKLTRLVVHLYRNTMNRRLSCI